MLAPLEVLVLDFFGALGFDCCIGVGCCIGCSLGSFLLGFGFEMEVDFGIGGWHCKKV